MKKIFLSFFLILSILTCVGCQPQVEDPNADQYNEYVEAYLNALYLGQFDKYMEITGVTLSQAEEFHNQTKIALTNDMKTYFALNIVVEDTLNELFDIAESLNSKLIFTVEEAYLTEDNTYSVKVQIQPVDFYQISDEAYSQFVTDFNQRVADGEYDGLSEQEYEVAYTDGIMDIIRTYAEQASNGESITHTVHFYFDEEQNSYFLKDEDLESLNSKLMLLP